jgi:hypothetical protein
VEAMGVDEQTEAPAARAARWRAHAQSAGKGTGAATQKAVAALVEAVGNLADAAVDHVLLSDKRVTSAAEAKRELAGAADTEALADKVQRVVVLAVPILRLLARGARFTRLPLALLASSTISIGIAVRSGVRELQVLASLLAYRIEQATGSPSDPTLVKKVAIDLYLKPKRVPDLSNDKLRLIRLTRKWVLGGAFGRETSKRAAKALDAAERLDVDELAARWEQRQEQGTSSSSS